MIEIFEFFLSMANSNLEVTSSIIETYFSAYNNNEYFRAYSWSSLYLRKHYFNPNKSKIEKNKLTNYYISTVAFSLKSSYSW